MYSRTLILSVALASVGCASANQADTASDDIGSDGAVEMIVRNRTTRTITAFADWRAGPRIRLGELRGGTTHVFTTPLRGTDVWLSLDVFGSPPVATTSNARAFGGGSTTTRGGTNDGGSNRARGFVPVDPGDRYEWEIRSVVPSIEMYYLRLPAR